MGEVLRTVGRWLDTKLFDIGGTAISVSTLATVILILAATLWFSKVLRRLVDTIVRRGGGSPGVAGTIGSFIHYTILLIGFGVALDTAGINLTALFAAGAIFAVGLGFAMQSIAQNFVAGVILLTERTITPGDIIEVQGRLVRLLDMGIRASVAETQDGENIIIPNSLLIQESVKNYTLRDSVYRIRVAVGVAYESDMTQVKETLLDAAEKLGEQWSAGRRDTQVLMRGFGDSAVQWEVAMWINDPWRRRRASSELHEAIWWALKGAGIVIAFPQVDVHLKNAKGAAISAAVEKIG